MKTKITLIGTLPPNVGISDTCYEQVNSISKYADMNFIDFKSLYPRSLFPGKIKDQSFTLKTSKNVNIERLISWYNPLSWIKAGLKPKTDSVHFHWWTFYLFPIFFTIILILKIRGKKIICETHNILGHETNIIDKILTKIIFKLPDHFIVHTKDSKKKLIEWFDIKKEISIITLGLPTFYLNKKISKTQARKYLKLKPKDRVLLFFGNIREYKGLKSLIKAFSIVKKKAKNVKLLIAGHPWTDQQEYQNLINELKLEKHIISYLEFIPTSEVKYFFSACDLVILPYTSFDAQSGPGRISLLFHKPLIVTNVGGLPDLVNDKDCIIEPDDYENMAKSIIKVLKDKKTLDKLSKNSRELYKKFSWSDIAEQTVKIYKKY
jgi:glycosyltransferase involved in cell wall biosynthesis